MTKVKLLALLAVVALILVLPAIALAQSPPELPCAFSGTVSVNGANVADGTVVTAMIGNATYTDTTANSTYSIIIAQPEGASYAGQTVTFKIGADTVSQTGTWEAGGSKTVNLIIGQQIIPGGGVGITSVELGNTTSYDPITGKLTLNKNELKGAKGDTGAAGAQGAAGPAGKSASSLLGIIAIVIAVIAIIVAVFVMMKKKEPAAPPPPKT